MNLYHDCVVSALKADGWRITADPLTLSYGGKDLYVDIAAERTTIAAEREGQLIAVEIQSFVGQSDVRDLEEAVGQYEVYGTLLAKIDPDRKLHMAVPQRVYDEFLTERFAQLVVSSLGIRLLVFDEKKAQVVLWTG